MSSTDHQLVFTSSIDWDSKGISDPFLLHFAYDINNIKFPKKLLYDDYKCTKPAKVIDLRGWILSQPIFDLMSKDCSTATHSIKLDNTTGLTVEHLDKLKGFKMKSLSVSHTSIYIDTRVAKLFGSFPSITELDISNCRVDRAAISIITQACGLTLQALFLRHCPGLDDFGMQSIATCISQKRRLNHLDLSNSIDFTDEGALAVLVSGPNVIKKLHISGCRNLSSLSIAGLRKKMTVLEFLDISNMPHLSQSSFEWIGEGCRALKVIDLSHSNEVDDAAIIAIGKKCQFVERLNLNRCIKVTDIGIAGFMENSDSRLKFLDISGCIQCGGVTTYAISTKAEELLEIKLNGLSLITEQGLQTLWNAAVKLEKFEMAIVLKSVTTHRKSMVPHISDVILKEAKYSKLIELKLTGAYLVTDSGINSLINKCKDSLRKLDVSYCSGITDKSLFALANKIQSRLLSVKVTGCNKITNIGIISLCRGCPLLEELEANGCSKINNDGVIAIAKHLELLQVLGLRNCDYVTDEALVLLKSCRHLRTLEISSLDMISIKPIIQIARYCKKLTVFNCESCNFTSKDFGEVVAKFTPLAIGVTGRCRLEARSRILYEYNNYVVQMIDKDIECRVLQKLCKLLFKNASMFRHRKMCRKAAADIARIYSDYCRRKRILIRKRIKKKRLLAAKILQNWFRHTLAIDLAIDKTSLIRKEKHARELIQRAYRGHMIRKRTNWKFRRLFTFYNKIGHLVHRWNVIFYARKLHRQILKVQSIARMFPRKVDYFIIRRGIVTLQHRYQNWKKRRHAVTTMLSTLIFWIESQEWAANRIRKMWRTWRFNKLMSPYILICAIWHRADFETRTWNALTIQRYWRGFIVRLRNYRINALPGWMYTGATKMQSLFRKYCVRKWYLIFKEKKKFFNRKWRFFMGSLPKLRLGKLTKRIQRFYRMYSFVTFKEKFAARMCHIYRGYRVRCKFLKMIYDIKASASGKIGRKWRRRQARLWRIARMAREHMAAYKIQRKQKTTFTPAQIRRINAATTTRLRKEAMDRKVKLLENRRLRVLRKIKDRMFFLYACRIQKRFRIFARDKKRRDDAARQRQALMDNTAEEITTRKRAHFFDNLPIPNPIRIAKNVAAAVSQVTAGPPELITDADFPRFQNSILRYQTKSILQEGFVKIHITVGDGEFSAFSVEQTQLKNSKMPYFELVNNDLSGRFDLQFFLWVMRGSGPECICDFEVDSKPTGLSLAKLRERYSKMSANGIKLAWHPHCNIEIRGICTIKQGIGGFAVSDIKITNTPEEGDSLIDKDYRLVEELKRFGFDTSVYILARTVIDDENLYKLGSLNAMDWLDKKLVRLIEMYNLSESDVYALRRNFDIINSGNTTDEVHVAAVFEYIGYEQTYISNWVVQAIKPKRKLELTFSEYVHLICYYVMFSRKDLCKFLFGCIDTDGNQFIRKDKFFLMIDYMCEGANRNPRVWQLQFEKFYDRKLNAMFVKGFDDFVKSNPSTLWTAQHLQRLFMENNLGTVYWENKMEQYRIMRKEIGVKLFG